MELSFDNTNLVDIQEEEITEEIIKELDECLNFINDVTVNMKEFYPFQAKKTIKLINKYINKFNKDDYAKYAEVREANRKLVSLKSNIELKLIYGEEKTCLNESEMQDLNEGMASVEVVKKNIDVLNNDKLEKVVDMTDSYIQKFSDYNYVKYDETRKCIRRLQSLKSDVLIKMYYENDEEEKVYLKCS